MIATRDTTKEIGETAKELKEGGMIRHNVEETVGAREKGKMVKHSARQVGESAPPTGDRREKLVHIDDKFEQLKPCDLGTVWDISIFNIEIDGKPVIVIWI